MSNPVVDIHSLSTLQVLWVLVKRHAIVLLITSNILTVLVWFITSAPSAYQNFVR